MTSDEFYKSINKSNDLDGFEGVISKINRDNKKSPFLGFDVNRIPEGAPVNPEFAFLYHKLAIEIPSYNQSDWQHYWFRCCISEKCNYIFSILKSQGVNREIDLEKICNRNSRLMEILDNSGKIAYIDACIDFFLRRYNYWGALWLFMKYPSFWNGIKMTFPRMMFAVILGFIPIATSEEIGNFVQANEPNLKSFSIILIIFSGVYLIFECYNSNKRTLGSWQYALRIVPILSWGLVWSLLFSHIFTSVKFLGPEMWNLYWVVFYASFALCIGILLQLLWEENTVTEPL